MRRAIVDFPQPDYSDQGQRLASRDREAHPVDRTQRLARCAFEHAVKPGLDTSKSFPTSWSASSGGRRSGSVVDALSGFACI